MCVAFMFIKASWTTCLRGSLSTIDTLAHRHIQQDDSMQCYIPIFPLPTFSVHSNYMYESYRDLLFYGIVLGGTLQYWEGHFSIGRNTTVLGGTLQYWEEHYSIGRNTTVLGGTLQYWEGHYSIRRDATVLGGTLQYWEGHYSIGRNTTVLGGTLQYWEEHYSIGRNT